MFISLIANWSCPIQRSIQHLVPSEILDEIQEIEQRDKESENEPAKQERLQRAAALNANILPFVMNQINNINLWGVWNVAFNLILYSVTFSTFFVNSHF